MAWSVKVCPFQQCTLRDHFSHIHNSIFQLKCRLLNVFLINITQIFSVCLNLESSQMKKLISIIYNFVQIFWILSVHLIDWVSFWLKDSHSCCTWFIIWAIFQKPFHWYSKSTQKSLFPCQLISKITSRSLKMAWITVTD